MADQYGVPDSNKNFDTTLTLTTSTGTCTPKSPSTRLANVSLLPPLIMVTYPFDLSPNPIPSGESLSCPSPKNVHSRLS
jgi:hypothetical protein